MAHFGKLTRRQIKSISALLSTQTIAEASALCGVSTRTLYRWLEQDDEFRQALMSAAGESISGSVRRLVAGQDDALDTLHELMSDALSENVRRLAALNWLDTLRHVHELMVFGERLSALERQVFGYESNE